MLPHISKKMIMTTNKEILLMTYSKYFPEENLYLLRQKLDTMTDEQINMLYAMPLKDPMICLVLSIVVGYLGVDRFYVGDVALGVIKLLTCGGLGVWTIVDYFLIMNRAKEKNWQTLMTFMG